MSRDFELEWKTAAARADRAEKGREIERTAIRNVLTEIMGLRTENGRLKVANDRALAEIERLRMRWWNHGDICSQLCSDACNEMHTFGHGCAFASDPVLSVTERPETWEEAQAMGWDSDDWGDLIREQAYQDGDL